MIYVLGIFYWSYIQVNNMKAISLTNFGDALRAFTLLNRTESIYIKLT